MKERECVPPCRAIEKRPLDADRLQLMSDEARQVDALQIVRGTAIASALIICAMLAVGRGAEGAGTRRLLAAGILAAPYVVILLASARGSSRSLALGLARGLGLAVIVGTIGGGGVAIVAVVAALFGKYDPAMVILIVLSGAGVLFAGAVIPLVIVLFILQIYMTRVAKRAIAAAPSDAADQGVFYGFLAIVLPLIVAYKITAAEIRGDASPPKTERERAEERKQAERQQLRQRGESMMHADRVARNDFARREATARRTVATLHVCVRTGCVDSLIKATRRAAISVVLHRRASGRYWGSVEDTALPWRFVTDETGMLLKWQVNPFFPTAQPDSDAGVWVADSTAIQLTEIARCFAGASPWPAGFPRRIDKQPHCGIADDTTVIRLGGGLYRVVYVPIMNGTASEQRVTSFALDARPVNYRDPAIRSFLIGWNAPSYVTTADRAANRSDRRLHDCEAVRGPCYFIP